MVLGTGVNTAGKLTAGANGTVPVYASGESTGMIPVAAKRSIFLSLAGGWTGTTLPDNGFVITETITNKVNYKGTSFEDSATDKNHEFGCVMPKNYNGGTIVGKPYFITYGTDASSHEVIFGLQGLALGDGETLDTAYGTAKESTTVVASSIAGLMKIGAATTAITIAGTPAGEEWVQFRTYRKGGDSSTNNVILLGWLITYTTNNYSDE